MIKFSSKIFIEKLIEDFHEIKEEVLDEDNLVLSSLQIAVLEDLHKKAIDSNSETTILKCFKFVNDNIDEVEFEIENSLTISWLGKLDFSNNSTAFKSLSPKLQSLYNNLQQYYSQPLNKKIKDF